MLREIWAGLVIDAYFSGTKLKWILDNVAGARNAAGGGELAFGTVDSRLTWQLTGDQQSAPFGQACFTSGLAKNTYGTGCFMLMHTGGQCHASRNGLITTSAAQINDTPEFAIEGSVFVGGAVVQWLRDGLQAIHGSEAVQGLAESVPDSGGVMFVPAFTGLGAPYWKPDARGAILGLSRGTTVAQTTLENRRVASADF